MLRNSPVLIILMTLFSCDMNIADTFEELFEIRAAVIELVNTKNVRVNIENEIAIGIVVTNSSLNDATSEQRKSIADDIISAISTIHRNDKKIKGISVTFRSHRKKFLIVDIHSTVQMFEYTAKDIKKLSPE